MDECKLFTVFLSAFDVSTRASLTTTISQMLYCVLGMQITWGKMGNYTSQPFSDRRTTSTCPIPNQWTELLHCIKLNIFLKTFLFKGCALLFLIASLISFEEN